MSNLIKKSWTVSTLDPYIHVSSFSFSRYKNDDKIAFYYTTERKETVGVGQMTFGELKKNVGLYASALRKFGIKKGDIVAGYLPNCPEAIIAMAAAASIGAIW